MASKEHRAKKEDRDSYLHGLVICEVYYNLLDVFLQNVGMVKADREPAALALALLYRPSVW